MNTRVSANPLAPYVSKKQRRLQVEKPELVPAELWNDLHNDPASLHHANDVGDALADVEHVLDHAHVEQHVVPIEEGSGTGSFRF